MKHPTDTEIAQKRAELIADDKKSLTYSDIEEAIVECRSGVARAAFESAVKNQDALFGWTALLRIISTYRSSIIEGRLQDWLDGYAEQEQLTREEIRFDSIRNEVRNV